MLGSSTAAKEVTRPWSARLRALRLEPWTAARPRVAVFLAVRQSGNAYLLASNGERGFAQRLSLAAAAEKRGVPVVVPSAEALVYRARRPGGNIAFKPGPAGIALHAVRPDQRLTARPNWTADASPEVSDAVVGRRR
jgi:hypothetical protein